MKSKIIAIYLPQFHRIIENDEWWGNGFTEWTNVKRGRPFYPGHYQPRKPLNDNYYDLSNLSVLESHTKLAQKKGIYGFGFYHYYFRGRKLLEKPIETYRDKSNERFPYCLIWANQSWARTWYGSNTNDRILLRQTYGREIDWNNHFNYLLSFFKDERYIKIDNKPVYIIYLPQDINCRKEMFLYWNDLARKNGFEGVYLIAMDTSNGKDQYCELYNAYLSFEPLSTFNSDYSWRRYLQNWKMKYNSKLNIDYCNIRNWILCNNAYSYSYLCRKIERKAEHTDYKTFPGIFSGWDNSARKDEMGNIVTGTTPLKFRKHLSKMLRIAEKNESEFLFLNAWNEWSEGAYIEPDKKYGYAYLNAIKRTIDEYMRG